MFFPSWISTYFVFLKVDSVFYHLCPYYLRMLWHKAAWLGLGFHMCHSRPELLMNSISFSFPMCAFLTKLVKFANFLDVQKAFRVLQISWSRDLCDRRRMEAVSLDWKQDSASPQTGCRHLSQGPWNRTNNPKVADRWRNSAIPRPAPSLSLSSIPSCLWLIPHFTLKLENPSSAVNEEDR